MHWTGTLESTQMDWSYQNGTLPPACFAWEATVQTFLTEPDVPYSPLPSVPMTIQQAHQPIQQAHQPLGGKYSHEAHEA